MPMVTSKDFIATTLFKLRWVVLIYTPKPKMPRSANATPTFIAEAFCLVAYLKSKATGHRLF